MDYAQVGQTGIEVSRLILGGGNFGGIGSAPEFFGQGESEEEARLLLDTAWELGITTFDTADAYGGGRSEAWIGRWLASKPPTVRERAVVCTKVFHSVEGDPTDSGLAPARILARLEGSLERLGLDRIPMYLTHEPDPATPIGETLAALESARVAGKVAAVGASNVDAAGLEDALAVGQAPGVASYGYVQNSYSLLDRSAQTGVLGLCERAGLGFMAFGPLMGGWLTGKYRHGAPYAPGSRMTKRPEPYVHLDRPETYSALSAFEREAEGRGVAMATLAIAWLLRAPGVTAVVVGPRRVEQLSAARTALDVRLTREEFETIGAAFR